MLGLVRTKLKATEKDLICSFRAPNLELYQVWLEFKQVVKDKGLDICRVDLGLIQAWLAAEKGANAALETGQQIVNIKMENKFLYEVKKPRREPHSLNCVKKEYRRTFSSILFEAYVLQKARDLNREFSFRDFLELKHDSFRRIVERLRRKGKIVANPQRTIPRFYFLPERLPDYQPRSKHNIVKQK